MTYTIQDLENQIIDNNVKQAVENTQSNFLQNTDWSIITKILILLFTKVVSNSKYISKCYSLYGDNNVYDKDKVLNLINMLSIAAEDNPNIEQYKLLAKCFSRIMKIRGTEDAIKYIIRVSRRTEEDLYIDDTDDTYISLTTYGNYNVIYDTRIDPNDTFVQYLINRVKPTGRGFTQKQQLYISNYTAMNIWNIDDETIQHGNIEELDFKYQNRSCNSWYLSSAIDVEGRMDNPPDSRYDTSGFALDMKYIEFEVITNGTI